MPLAPDWLAGQGDDAFLLYSVSVLPEIERAIKIGVAVSGGSDSMALLHLLVRFGRQVGIGVEAITVDHGLRPEAKDEAAFVAENCAALGVGHDVLEWRRGSATGNLQDQAARGRYALMSVWARERGISVMATGHTADDQAETFLMQLARRAGIDGLSGMRQVWTQGQVVWCRPLLMIGRQDLRAYLDRNAVRWVDDPSNQNTDYERVRVRQFMPQLAAVGLDAGVLADVTMHLASAKRSLDAFCQSVAAAVVTQQHGDLVMDRAGLMLADPEIRRRLLVAALRWVSGREYAPRSSAQGDLDIAIHSGKSMTLSGCRIVSTPRTVRVTREHNAVRNLSAASDQPWDNRWTLTGQHHPSLTVRPLGDDGLGQCPDWRMSGMPRYSLLASPAIWDKDTLVAAPLAGKPAGWTARIATDFHAFLVSH